MLRVKKLPGAPVLDAILLDEETQSSEFQLQMLLLRYSAWVHHRATKICLTGDPTQITRQAFRTLPCAEPWYANSNANPTPGHRILELLLNPKNGIAAREICKKIDLINRFGGGKRCPRSCATLVSFLAPLALPGPREVWDTLVDDVKVWNELTCREDNETPPLEMHLDRQVPAVITFAILAPLSPVRLPMRGYTSTNSQWDIQNGFSAVLAAYVIGAIEYSARVELGQQDWWRYFPSRALYEAWLLVSSSPFQGVFYGLPLLLGTALWAARSELRTPVVVGACLGAVLWVHRDFYSNALDGFEIYERARLLELQDQKLMGDGGPVGLALRTVAGLVVPFVGYGHHAEGNLLVFLPILLATGIRPGRGLALALGVVLVLGLVPAFGPVRQMDRMLWSGVLLVGLHCGLQEDRVSARRLRLSLGLAFGLGATMMGLRLVMQPLSPFEDRTTPEGITGLAVPTSQHPLQDGYAEGFFRSIRRGLVLPRPAAHVVIPPFPGAVDGSLVEDPRFTLEAKEGRLLVRGPFVSGDGVTLSLRGDSRVRSLLQTPDPVRLEADGGRLRIVALEELDQVEITSR